MQAEAGWTDVLLPYAQDATGRLIPVRLAERGLDCGCVCPKCHKRVVAKKGEVVVHHFAHCSEKDAAGCSGALETMAHLLGKQVIMDNKLVRVPEYRAAAKTLIKQADVKATLVEKEVPYGQIQPDLLFHAGSNRVLAIEILVRHATGDDKIATFRAHGVPAVEIDLSRMPVDCDDKDFILLTAPRKWLYHPIIDADAADRKWEITNAAAERLRYESRLLQKDFDRVEATKVGLLSKEQELDAKLRRIENSQSILSAIEERERRLVAGQRELAERNARLTKMTSELEQKIRKHERAAAQAEALQQELKAKLSKLSNVAAGIFETWPDAEVLRIGTNEELAVAEELPPFEAEAA